MNVTTLTRGDLAAVSSKTVFPASAHPVTIAERKLGVLKRTGLFGENVKGCTIERACTADDLSQAYRLVHDVFVGSGFMDADPSGTRLRMYEATPLTATFVAKVEGRVVAVLSVVEDSEDLGLPSDGVFKAELDALRRGGRRLCEVTNQAVAEDYRKSGVPTELMRCAIAISLTEGHQEAIAAVSPSHNGFYDLLGFRQIGSQRSYSQTIDDPVIAVSMDIDQYRDPKGNLSTTAQFIRQFFTAENHFLSRMVDWAREARRQFLNPDLLRKLFVVERNMLARCSVGELAVLRRRWGHATFAAVAADIFIPSRAGAKTDRASARIRAALPGFRGTVASRASMRSPFGRRTSRPRRSGPLSQRGFGRRQPLSWARSTGASPTAPHERVVHRTRPELGEDRRSGQEGIGPHR